MDRLTHATLFKLTGPNGAPANGGSGAWPLPTQDAPGDWRAVRGALVPCENGLHLCTAAQLLSWTTEGTNELYVAEHHGDPKARYWRRDGPDKIVVRKARLLRRVDTWNERTLRLLAADYAEDVLPYYESCYPGDTRVRDCIAVARRYARGEATAGELMAARSAAAAAANENLARISAARSVPWSAARSAAWAAWSAARSAAPTTAAWAAARSAEWAAWAAVAAAPTPPTAALTPRAVQEAQTDRLLSYLNGDIALA